MKAPFWSSWTPSPQEAAYVHALEDALARITSIDGVLAVFVGGSFVRRELHSGSDLDVWTITDDMQTLETVRALSDTSKPHVSFHGFTVAELESGRRSNPKEGESSVKRFVSSIPDLELVYGSLDTSSMPALSAEEDLAGRMRGWPIMLEKYRSGTMTFSLLAKYFCWIVLTRDGTVKRVLDLRTRYPEDHIVSRAVLWSREEPCGDEDAAAYEMDAFVEEE